jgi:hypothetical protein
MAENLFDKASYSLVRTNPKLTANVKVVSDGTDIYLESFSANTRLSSQKFKAFKVDGTSTYDQDVFRFFDFGKFPIEAAYEIFQEYEDTSVLSKYGNQYEMFYCAGTRSVASTSYPQSLGTLAPLWLNEQIPNYFVVFRLDNPAAVNNFRAPSQNENTASAQTSVDFNKNVLENCTAIKTFDLTEGTVLGSYIRNYRNQENFPEVPLNMTWRKDEPILWNGISYKSGGFTSSGNFAYKDMVVKDSTIMQDEYLFTQGFQNNGIILANLLNMEFLFDDPTADDYSINRYFGMYVNDIEEGKFDISGEAFYKGTSTEKTQQPVITSITEVSQFLNTPLELTNKNGILLYLDPLKTETITGLPTPQRVDEVESIFYVKDKEDDFHTIKKGSTWNKDQIRLFDTKVDISLFTGYKDPDTFANASILNRAGISQMYIKVLDNVEEGSKISFYDGVNFTGEIFADSTMATIPGKSFERFFNPNGTLQEVTQSITSAINKGINENDRFFVASYNDTTVYVKSRFSGTRFNRLNFKMDISFPEQFQQLETYPATSLALPDKNFVGGNDTKNSLLKVTLGDQERFVKGNFVQTTGGYTEIGDWVPYTDEPIYDGLDQIIGYTDIDKYAIITCNDNQIMVTRSNQVALYSDYKPSFGRFSFFEVKDFDFDFYSTLYSEEGELNFELAEYNQLVANAVQPYSTTPPFVDYTGVSKNPNIRNFYDNGGFYNLIGLLNDAEDQNPNDEYIKSEYNRLEENFITSQAAASRIAPYINKWAWVNNGKDVRNHPYRLDVNEAFGINNFAPSKWDKVQESSGFTHEWYYLSEFPKYFLTNNAAIKSSWSYVDKAATDSINANPVTGQVYVPGTFQDINTNYFNDYFIVQRFTAGGTINEIDRQLRYGRFAGGNENNFSETFLRGVRIIAKPKAIGSQKPNFNASSLSYVQDGSINDYRFSVMLVPNLPDKPELEIKFIKNEKWKTIVMLVSIQYDVECLNAGAPIIDRTSLYSLNSNFDLNSDCSPQYNSASGYLYKSLNISGALSLNSSSIDSNGIYIIKGQPDINGIPTNFVNDIRVLEDGTFGNIKFGIGTNVYQITGIVDVLDSDTFKASTFTQNGFPMALPSSSPGDAVLRSATYTIQNGGYQQFSNSLNNISFGEIFDSVNEGNPAIVYETITEDGTQVRNTDGTLAQTFSIELRAQADILKSIYVGILPDPVKPTAFNLTDVVGYDLSLQKTPRITPIARHAGYYEPYALPLLSFRDPYQNLDFEEVTGGTGSVLIPDAAYKIKVMELCKFKNSQFNSSDPEFGQIQNFFYHKVNEEDPSTILELSSESAFSSLYPLINEIGIDYKDFYIFSSNWEPSYFIKSIDKSQIQNIIGTRSMFERKSFFGSKYLKVPETIKLETFKPSPFVKGAIKQPSLIDGTFMYLDQPSVKINKRIIKSNGVKQVKAIKKKPSSPIETFFLLNEKRLIEYLFTPIKEQFQKYINPLYGWGDLETLDDDVEQYIRENILKLYKIEKVEFYSLASRIKNPPNYTTAELTDAEKINNGLTINNNVASKTLNTNPFDLKLIYNKRTGFSESYGFSVTIVKK